MLTDILDQRERLINTRWLRELEVHMNIDDYHRLAAEIMKTEYGRYLIHDDDCNYIYGMEIVIDDSEQPCVKLTE